MKPSQIDKTLHPGAITQAQRLADRLYPPTPHQRHSTSMTDWLKDDDCATRGSSSLPFRTNDLA
ncbi:MAG: hypothetical protein H7842_14590, partial [Gammaproteobacteria bacterium SHHR-1]